MIDDLYIKKGVYFTNEFVQQCKLNANIPQSIPSDTNKKTKAISLEGRLYSQVAMIRRLIVKDNGNDHNSVEDRENNHSNDTPNVNDQYKDTYYVV